MAGDAGERSARIRVMSRGDLRTVLDWAAAEGWNPGIGDDVPFMVADPTGYLVATTPDDDPAISAAISPAAISAAISMVRYGRDFAFLGLYIARPDRRGRGLGWAVWSAGLARLTGRVIGLDGVLAQQDNYRKSGFALAYRNIRHQGPLPVGSIPAGAASGELVDIAAIPFDALSDYDHPCFGAERAHFLAAWIANPESIGLAVMADGHLAGYGVVRRCREGWKIGPLFANGPAEAETLFLGLCGRVGEAGGAGPVVLDTPEVNPAAVALAERHGLTPVFETARMYAGPAPAIDTSRVFGVTSFELG